MVSIEGRVGPCYLCAQGTDHLGIRPLQILSHGLETGTGEGITHICTQDLANEVANAVCLPWPILVLEDIFLYPSADLAVLERFH